MNRKEQDEQGKTTSLNNCKNSGEMNGVTNEKT